MSWSNVAKRISALIKNDRYLTEKEKQQLAEVRSDFRDPFEHFLPIVLDTVARDIPYQNACKNSDAQEARTEAGVAIKRAIASLNNLDLIRLYYDDADFHSRMDQAVFNETYYQLKTRPLNERNDGQTEDDPFPDIDPAAIREELERRGIVNGELVDPDKESPFVRQVMADVERIAAEEAKDRQTPDRETADSGLMLDQEDTAERNTEELKALSEDAESLAPEERFHVIDTEFGSDGAYSIWDDKTGDYYVDTDGNHVYFSDRWVAEDYRDELIERAQEEAARSPLDRAKELLDEYCMEEFGEPVDLSDMSRIGIGFTTITDEDIPIEASVNLEEFKLERYLNGVLFDTRQYGSLEELVSKELEYLDFDTLMDATDDESEEAMAQTEKAPEELAQPQV
ncbi:MAG: hypothetical protein LUE31_00710, partial [Lachnospiraceae bacterium]|nr:hypothetical protein [Lachnospiraceae bacterium]